MVHAARNPATQMYRHPFASRKTAKPTTNQTSREPNIRIRAAASKLMAGVVAKSSLKLFDALAIPNARGKARNTATKTQVSKLAISESACWKRNYCFDETIRAEEAAWQYNTILLRNLVRSQAGRRFFRSATRQRYDCDEFWLIATYERRQRTRRSFREFGGDRVLSEQNLVISFKVHISVKNVARRFRESAALDPVISII
jgi:hypothetical protein